MSGNQPPAPFVPGNVFMPPPVANNNNNNNNPNPQNPGAPPGPMRPPMPNTQNNPPPPPMMMPGGAAAQPPPASGPAFTPPPGVFIPGASRGPGVGPPPMGGNMAPPMGPPPVGPPPMGGGGGMMPPPVGPPPVGPPPVGPTGSSGNLNAGVNPNANSNANMMRAGPGATTKPALYAEAAMGPSQPQFAAIPDAFADHSQMGAGGMGGGGGGGGGAPGQPQYNVPAVPISGPLTQPIANYTFSPTDPDQAAQNFVRMTTSCFPGTPQVLAKWGLPFGAVIQPLADTDDIAPIDVVNFGQAGIIRCKSCRTYVNPFVRWLEGGRKWQCNMCGISNHVPPEYFCNLDQTTGRRMDHNERPELSKGSCEFIASLEYMVRPPQAPTYVFVLDVSYNSLQNHALHATCSAIRSCLASIPGETRTQVAFITVSGQISVFNLRSTLSTPQMIVLPDVNDVFLPIPDDLLVNLSESNKLITDLLTRLPAMHQGSTDVECALGPALQLAYQLIKPVGGKILLFSSTLPSLGQGRLKVREPHGAGGASAAAGGAPPETDTSLLQPSDDYFKNFAIECVRNQVSIDTFLFTSSYIDFATLSALSKYTCGESKLYFNFNSKRDGAKYKNEVSRVLLRETGFEAVMRIRLSRGLKINRFFGHYFVRGPDLLSLPTVDADKSFGIELGFEEQGLAGESRASMQVALLYTNSNGERRIRVHTICFPVVNNLSDMFRYTDVETTMAMIGKIAIDKALEGKLSGARDYMKSLVVTSLKSYLVNCANQSKGGNVRVLRPGGAGQLLIPESLNLLPLFTLGLQKSPVFSPNPMIRNDMRAYLMMCLAIMNVPMTTRFLHPRLFLLTDFAHDIMQGAEDPNASQSNLTGFGTDGDSSTNLETSMIGPKKIVLPPLLPLTSSQIVDHGIYLLDDAVSMYLYIGRASNPVFAQKVLGVDLATIRQTNPNGFDFTNFVLERQDNEVSKRFSNLVRYIRGSRTYIHQQIFVAHDKNVHEMTFLDRLIEDRSRWNVGYLEFLSQLTQQVSAP